MFVAVLSTCNLFGGAEKSASGEYVLSSAGPNGSEHTLVGKIIPERFHAFLVLIVQVYVGYLVKSDEVYPAIQSFNKLNQLARMKWRVV